MAVRHAPLVRIDRAESLLPTDVTGFVSRSTLRFAAGAAESTVTDRIEAERLGSDHLDPYLFDHSGIGEIWCTAHTRPHDERPSDLALPESDGFALTLREPEDVRGTPSAADDATVYEGAPVYYDYRPGESVSYWFFYAGSALPALIARRLRQRNEARDLGGPEAFVVETPSAEDAAARQALLQSNGELFSLVADQPFEGLGLGDMWDKLNTYVKAIGRESFLCHEGDWEHVTVFLNPEDELADPLTVDFEAHGKKGGVAWAEVDKEDGRLVVYSGRGSHASLPKAGKHWSTGDVGDADGLRWRTWEQLEPVKQGWWGFGGAWGRVGSVGDLTGPLGPSPYKGTRVDG